MSASSKQVKSCLPMKRQSSSVSKETQYTETDEDRTDSDWEFVSQETPARKRQIRIDKEKRSQKAREKQRRTKHARSILDCPSSVDQSVPHEAYFRNSFIGCADGIDRSCLKMKVKFRDNTEPSYVSMFENGVISVDVITIKRFAFFCHVVQKTGLLSPCGAEKVFMERASTKLIKFSCEPSVIIMLCYKKEMKKKFLCTNLLTRDQIYMNGNMSLIT